MMFNMFHGTLQPLAGAARTLSQLGEDGLLPRFLAGARATDCPWVATLPHRRHGHHLPADRRSDLADRGRQLHLSHRHLHAERRGLAAAPRSAGCRAPLSRAARHDRARRWSPPAIWLLTAMLGFQQFGLPTVLFGLALRLFGRGALRLAQSSRIAARQGLPGAGADAAHQAHRRDAARARARRRRLSAGGRQRAGDQTARWSRCWRTSSSPSPC